MARSLKIILTGRRGTHRHMARGTHGRVLTVFDPLESTAVTLE